MLQQGVLTLGGNRIEFGEGDLRVRDLLGANQPQGDFWDSRRREFEQALVDVADLLDIQGAVGEELSTALLFENLQSGQEQQHRPVVDRERCRR